MRAPNGVILALLLAAASLGCQGEPQPAIPETFPVTGAVTTRQGAPAADAVIDFRPASGVDNGLIINAVTDARGQFEMRTRHINDRTKAREKIGAPAGDYRVTITPKQPEDQQQAFALPVHWPQPVTIAAQPNVLTFDLAKAPARK